MDWLQKFKEEEGKRLIFLGLATLFGLGLLIAGITMELKELTGSGITLLIGAGTLCMNRARGTTNGNKPEAKPPTEGGEK